MRSQDESLVGRKVGRFKLIEEIGRGGMGVVYRARDPDLARDVAVKLLSRDTIATNRARTRFLREARAAASVQHPGIATVFEVGEQEGDVFLVMELLEGRSLAAVLEAGRLPVTEALAVVRQLATALRHAHAAGIVHRDVKPENIMLDADGHAKLLDFGIAKSLDRTSWSEHDATEDASFRTIEGRIVGTPAYMSPEQAQGKTVDHRSDLFSVGVVLYEMLCGELPFSGSGPVMLLASITRDDPIPMSQHRGDIPTDVAILVGRLLEKDPEQRVADASQLIEALDAADLMRMGPPASPAAESPPGSRLGIALAAVAVLSAVLAVAVSAAIVASSGGPGPTVRESGPVEIEDAVPPPPALVERRLTANPAELWVTSALPTPSGLGFLYQDEDGVFRRASLEEEPEPLTLPHGLVGVLRSVFDDGRLLFGVEGEDLGPIHVVDGDEARRIEVSALASALAPDQTHVVYVGDGAIRVVGVDGEGDRRLTALGPGEEVEQLAVSPNGLHLLFVRVRRRAEEVTASLEVVDLDGSDERTLIQSRRLLQTGGMTAATWRNDQRILYGFFGPPDEATHTELWEIGLEEGSEPTRIHVFQASGITELHMTPEGLMLMKLEAQADVVVAALGDDGSLSSPRRLTASDRNDRPGDVDPQGRVAFVSDRFGTWDIMVQGLDEARAVRWTRGDALDTYPRFDPSGAIVFFRLFVDADGSIPRGAVMRTQSPADEPALLFDVPVEPALRPGGRPPPEAARIRCGAYGCAVSFMEADSMVFERFDPRSPEREPLLRRPRPPAYYDWDVSGDGTTLALVEGSDQVTVLRLDDPDHPRVMTPVDGGRLLTVTFGGEGWLVATGLHVGGDRYSIHRIGLDGEAVVMHRSSHTYFAHPVVTADGRTLVFAQQNYDLDVWRLDGLAP